MQCQIRQDEKQEQGSNFGNQEYYAKNEGADDKTPPDSNTKELGPLTGSAESITERTNNELYELLMQLQRLVQTETAYISGMISEIRYKLRDDRDDTRGSDSGYSDEGSSDDDSQSDYENEKYSEDDDSTDDDDSDRYSTDEYRGRSRERKNPKVASQGQVDAPPRYRGRFPIAVAALNNQSTL